MSCQTFNDPMLCELVFALRPIHLVALAAYAFIILVMPGRIGAKIGVHELFDDQPAHIKAIASRPLLAFVTPAFISRLMLTIWIGLTLTFIGFDPFFHSENPGTSFAFRNEHGWFIGALFLLAGIASLAGRRRSAASSSAGPAASQTILRHALGIVTGIALTVALLVITHQAATIIEHHISWPANEIAFIIPLLITGTAFAITLRWNWLLTCAAWFTLLILITTLAAAASVIPFSLTATAAAVLFFGTACRITRFRYRLPGIPDECYDNPIPANSLPQSTPETLLTPSAVLNKWAETLTDTSTDNNSEKKPRLVLLAASGGAYRATFWTAAVLDALARYDHTYPTTPTRITGPEGEKLDGLMNSIRLITGASGGMVAAAYLAEQSARIANNGTDVPDLDTMITSDIAAYQGHGEQQVSPPGMKPPRKWLVPVPRDSLAPIAWQILKDLLHLVRRGPTFGERGRVLEAQWETLMKPFSALRQEEENGTRPSIIFSPMLIETGAPIFISNLNLEQMRTSFAGEKIEQHSRELFRLFPKSYRNDPKQNHGLMA